MMTIHFLIPNSTGTDVRTGSHSWSDCFDSRTDKAAGTGSVEGIGNSSGSAVGNGSV